LKNGISPAMKIYPNPMTDNSIIEFCPPEAGEAVITVYDMTGKVLTEFQSYLENYMQEFRISGLQKGIYLVNVSGNGYQSSGKILCNGLNTGSLKIDKTSFACESVTEKTVKKNLSGSHATVDMEYASGERLKFKAISGKYSTVRTDIPTLSKALSFNFVPCTDKDDNNYSVVEIGTQIWMAENLRTTRYNDSTIIPSVTDNTEWINLSTPAYCWYSNDSIANAAANGALYNYYALTTNKLCPNGWHVPTDTEWKTLEMFLGMTQEEADASGPRGTEQGTLLKSTSGWTVGGIGNGTNALGFTVLPSGIRGLNTGEFEYFGNTAVFWSTTEIFGDGAICRHLWLEETTVRRAAEESYYVGQRNGYSVRCLKD
jgi:uncharacterized protein (TIGR02145 family)